MQKITQENISEIIENDEISDICFYGIKFSNYNFSAKRFHDCEFQKCNLSNIQLKNTTFDTILLKDCKIMWLKFVDLESLLLQINFYDCDISLCSFYGLEMKNTTFADCEIKECDFTQTHLQNSKFEYCNLEKSIFFQTKLEKVDFSGSHSFVIDPNHNTLKWTIFNRENVFWLLQHLDIQIK